MDNKPPTHELQSLLNAVGNGHALNLYLPHEGDKLPVDLPVEPLEAVPSSPRPSLLIGNLVPAAPFDLSALDVCVVNEAEAAEVLGLAHIGAPTPRPPCSI